MIKKCSVIFTGTCALILLVLGIGGPLLLGSLINSAAQDQIVMGPDNIGVWGQVPGETGVDIKRYFTFYDFQNPREVIFQHAIPTFEETTKEFSYYERQNFTNVQFNNDKTEIDYYIMYRFPKMEGSQGSDNITAINFGPMAAWFQMKSADRAQLTLQGLSLLISSIKYEIMEDIVGIGISQIPLSLFSSQSSTKKLIKEKIDGLSSVQEDLLVSDKMYGLNKDCIVPWVQISYKRIQDGESTMFPSLEQMTEEQLGLHTIIQNYFNLNLEQMTQIRSIVYNGNGSKSGVKAAYLKYIVQSYCMKTYKGFGSCSPETFSILQWTGQGITNYTPFFGLGIPSITKAGNDTAVGYPEINYYYSQQFSKPGQPFYVEGGEDDKFKNQFDHTNKEIFQWGQLALATLPKNEYIKTEHALFNIGNLRTIFELGEKFDLSKENYETSSIFQQLHKKFGLPNMEQSYIFWNYLKYFVDYFVNQKNIGGNSGITALGAVVSGGLTDSFQRLTNFLLPTVTSNLISEQLKKQNCFDIFRKSPFTYDISANICRNIFNIQDYLTPVSQDNFLYMMQVCTGQNIQQYNDFIKKAGCTTQQLQEFCIAQDGEDKTSFSGAWYSIGSEISNYYGCTQYTFQCTNYEFAARQWANSQITRSVPDVMKKLYKPSNTVNSWFPEEFPAPFENGWFAPIYYSHFSPPSVTVQTDGEKFEPTFEQANNILNFNRMFAPTLLSDAFIWGLNLDGENDQKQITDKFLYTNIGQFIAYLRYCALELGFGGFLQTRSADTFLYGYDDPFLQQLAEQNPQEGGDPSIPYFIAVGQANQTEVPNPKTPSDIQFKESMKTGKDNLKNVRQLTSVAGTKTIHVAEPFFDGERVIWRTRNPYIEEIPIKGTDASSFTPPEMLNNYKDPIQVYIDTLFAYKILDYKETLDHHGLECYRYQPSAFSLANGFTNKDNFKFEQWGPNGLQNLTSIMNVPVFNSQTHFYLGDEDLYSPNNITILRDGKPQLPSDYDKTYIDVEKYTGASLAINLNIQLNYEMSPDVLFPVPFRRYLPLYYMARGANWTESNVDGQFKPLKIGLGIKLGMLIGGLSLGGILTILFIVLLVKYKKQNQGSIEAKRTDSELQEDMKNPLILSGVDEKVQNKINPTYSEYQTNISIGQQNQLQN